MAEKTLILSDLHLGNGGDYDIFAGARELPALLARYAQPGNTVLLNGDSIDFLMNEDPLKLDEQRAVEQIDRSLSDASTAEVLAALGRILLAGSDVVVLLGNHDIELALGKVQERVRAALQQPSAVAARLRFERGESPRILHIGGARILVTHGNHNDPWNRVNYASLPGPGSADDADGDEFVYSPGSRLVKTLANPLKRRYQMRFADLIKPDFQGGVLTALAVNPLAVRTVFQGSTLTLLWQLFKQSKAPNSFSNHDEPQLGIAQAIESAGLTDDEQAALRELLSESGAAHFGDDDEVNPQLDSARAKLGRAGLKLYAQAQRRAAGKEGESFFSLEPSSEEWSEAQRLAKKFDAGAVIIGHTHAARFKHEGEVTYLNTGTWIWLMSLPKPDASDEEWTEFLETCRKNPRLDPKKGRSVPLITRFTAAEIEPAAQGGARLSLIEWKDGAVKTLASSHIAAARSRS